MIYPHALLCANTSDTTQGNWSINERSTSKDSLTLIVNVRNQTVLRMSEERVEIDCVVHAHDFRKLPLIEPPKLS